MYSPTINLGTAAPCTSITGQWFGEPDCMLAVVGSSHANHHKTFPSHANVISKKGSIGIPLRFMEARLLPLLVLMAMGAAVDDRVPDTSVLRPDPPLSPYACTGGGYSERLYSFAQLTSAQLLKTWALVDPLAVPTAVTVGGAIHYLGWKGDTYDLLLVLPGTEGVAHESVSYAAGVPNVNVLAVTYDTVTFDESDAQDMARRFDIAISYASMALRLYEIFHATSPALNELVGGGGETFFDSVRRFSGDRSILQVIIDVLTAEGRYTYFDEEGNLDWARVRILGLDRGGTNAYVINMFEPVKAIVGAAAPCVTHNDSQPDYYELPLMRTMLDSNKLFRPSTGSFASFGLMQHNDSGRPSVFSYTFMPTAADGRALPERWRLLGVRGEYSPANMRFYGSNHDDRCPRSKLVWRFASEPTADIWSYAVLADPWQLAAAVHGSQTVMLHVDVRVLVPDPATLLTNASLLGDEKPGDALRPVITEHNALANSSNQRCARAQNIGMPVPLLVLYLVPALFGLAPDACRFCCPYHS